MPEVAPLLTPPMKAAVREIEVSSGVPIDEVLRSIREELPLWKPNSAIVVVDFALRHGFIEVDHPDYMEIAHLLRSGHD